MDKNDHLPANGHLAARERGCQYMRSIGGCFLGKPGCGRTISVFLDKKRKFRYQEEFTFAIGFDEKGTRARVSSQSPLKESTFRERKDRSKEGSCLAAERFSIFAWMSWSRLREELAGSRFLAEAEGSSV